jgi:hypothetical protein
MIKLNYDNYNLPLMDKYPQLFNKIHHNSKVFTIKFLCSFNKLIS